MYRHRLRGPGGNRVAITGHAGLTGSIQNLFVKALGAVTLALGGRTALFQTLFGYETSSGPNEAPVWGSPAGTVFNIVRGGSLNLNDVARFSDPSPYGRLIPSSRIAELALRQCRSAPHRHRP